MNVTFVYPKTPYFYDRTPYPPLGIGYLAANVKDLASRIHCVDGQILNSEEYTNATSAIEDDVICISATLLQMKEAGKIADTVKTRHPSTPVIIGGYGPRSLSPQDLFQIGKFDIFFRGEGDCY